MNFLEKLKPFAAMLIVNFAFALTNVLFKKALSEGLNNLVSIVYRQLIAVVFLAPIAYCIERKSWPKLTFRLVWGLFFSAMMGSSLTSYFYLIGLNYTSATYSCAFGNIMPVTTFILALCFGVEKLNVKNRRGRAKVLGTLICVGGALILVLYKGMPIINPHASEYNNHIRTQKASDNIHSAKDWTIGSIFLMLAIFAWSSWFLIQSRIGKSFPFPYSSTAIMSFFSAIQAAVLSFIVDRNISVWVVKGPLEISTIVFSGIVGSGICYVVMCWCIKIKGPVFTSAFSPFIQIFAAIFDVSILHSQIHLGSIVGSFIVIVGMYILLWGKSSDQGETSKQEENNNGDHGNCDSQVTLPVTNCPLKLSQPIH